MTLPPTLPSMPQSIVMPPPLPDIGSIQTHDSNQDGVLDRKEFVQAGGNIRQFDKYDKDQDGFLDEEELQELQSVKNALNASNESSQALMNQSMQGMDLQRQALDQRLAARKAQKEQAKEVSVAKPEACTIG